MAFVAKIASTEDPFLSIFWEESEVLITNGQLNPDIRAAMSDSIIPDLDADDDGFSNFSEIVEGSDPFDPNSIPSPPVMISEVYPITDDMIQMELTFNDVSGVASIEPVGIFKCGYFDWKVELLDPEGETQVLKTKFNLHAHNLSDPDVITLDIRVTDTLGLTETYKLDIPYTKVDKDDLGDLDDLNKPEIYIAAPLDGETVITSFDVEAEACDADGIEEFVLSNIGGFQDGDATNEGILGILGIDQISATQILTFSAKDGRGISDVKSVTVNVDGDNPIKIDAPTPGQTLQDGFTVVAHVDKTLMADVIQFYIDKVTIDPEGRTPIFALNQLKFDVNSLPEAFTGQIFDTSEIGQVRFYLHFVAVGTNRTETLVVGYNLNNKPIIIFDVVAGGPKYCFDEGEGGEDGRVDLTWRVDGVGEDGGITLSYSDRKGAKFQPEFSNDTNDFGAAELFFSSTKNSNFDAPKCRPVVKMEAWRNGFYPNTGDPGFQIFADPVEIPLTPLTVEGPDEDEWLRPVDVMFTFKDLDGDDLDVNLTFRVDIDDGDGDADPSVVINSTDDGKITGGDLGLTNYRYYTITFTLLADDNENSNQEVSVSRTFRFSTLHDNLVAYWPLDNFSAVFVDDTVEEFFGNLDGTHTGVFNGDNDECTISGECGVFKDESITIPNNAIINPTDPGTPNNPESFSIEAWVRWNEGIDQFTVAEGPIFYKEGQYEIRVITDLTLKLWFSVTDNSNSPVSVMAEYDATQLDPNEWYHIVGTYNGDDVMLYVDGGEAPISGTTSTVNNDTTPLLIGKGLSFYHDGLMDEVKFYNKALSQTEIGESINFDFQ